MVTTQKTQISIQWLDLHSMARYSECVLYHSPSSSGAYTFSKDRKKTSGLEAAQGTEQQCPDLYDQYRKIQITSNHAQTKGNSAKAATKEG